MITAKNTKLPEGMRSWKEYTISLLKKLPQSEAHEYRTRFAKSMKFWRKRGASLDDATITKLDNLNVKYKIMGTTKFGKKIVALKQSTPDDTESGILSKVPSWKRMCMCILKNDVKCEYMGF
jgi:predicted phosphoadenosine phosphosulfate sulfurtransferase